MVGIRPADLLDGSVAFGNHRNRVGLRKVVVAGYEVYCPYPSCRGVFRVMRRPRGGETLRCNVCGDPFIFQVANQAQTGESRHRRIQTNRVLHVASPSHPPRLPFSTRLTRRTQWFVVGGLVGLLVVGITVSLVLEAVSGQDNQRNFSVPEPRSTPARSAASTPTLREYWDIFACFDLFDRIAMAKAAGLSDDVIGTSMTNSEGAVKRYGLVPVLQHCERNYMEDYIVTQ